MSFPFSTVKLPSPLLSRRRRACPARAADKNEVGLAVTVEIARDHLNARRVCPRRQLRDVVPVPHRKAAITVAQQRRRACPARAADKNEVSLAVTIEIAAIT